MSEPQDEVLPEAENSKEVFTPAQRIAELNEIDKLTASLLKSAGQAIKVLGNPPPADSPQPTLDSQKAAFTEHSSNYFATLSKIEVGLRRQIYALEEAALIAPGDERDAKRGRTLGGEDTQRAAGAGPLDSSWLNARANTSVEKGMERELWSRARALAENTKQGQDNAVGDQDNHGAPAEDGMDVD